MIELQMKHIYHGLSHNEPLVVKDTMIEVRENDSIVQMTCKEILLRSTLVPGEKFETDVEVVAHTISHFLRDNITKIDQKSLSDLNTSLYHRIRNIESSLYGYFSIFNVIFYPEYRTALEKEQAIFYQFKTIIDCQAKGTAPPPPVLKTSPTILDVPSETPTQNDIQNTPASSFLRTIFNAISPSNSKRLRPTEVSQPKKPQNSLLLRLRQTQNNGAPSIVSKEEQEEWKT